MLVESNEDGRLQIMEGERRPLTPELREKADRYRTLISKTTHF